MKHTLSCLVSKKNFSKIMTGWHKIAFYALFPSLAFIAILIPAEIN
jgi:hypothetical protein